MSRDETFVATSAKYPALVGQEFDLSKGIFVLIKNGQEVVAQSDSNFKIISSLSSHVTSSDDRFQLVNLLLVRDDLHFLQHLYCVGNGYSMKTPEIPLVFYDRNGLEHRIRCKFLVDTGSTMSSIPATMNPFPINMVDVTVETGGGMQTQQVTKVQVVIDDQSYYVMACINQASTCILGMDILKYYTLTIDGDKAGVLIKNSLSPRVEDELLP